MVDVILDTVKKEVAYFLEKTSLNHSVEYSNIFEQTNTRYAPYKLASTYDLVFDINCNTGALFQKSNFFTNTVYHLADYCKNVGDVQLSKDIYKIAYHYESQMSYKIVLGSFPTIVDIFNSSVAHELSFGSSINFFEYYIKVLSEIKEDKLENYCSFNIIIPLYNNNVTPNKTADIISSNLFDKELNSLKVPFNKIDDYMDIPLDWVNILHS
jgi:hypothetical protein